MTMERKKRSIESFKKLSAKGDHGMWNDGWLELEMEGPDIKYAHVHKDHWPTGMAIKYSFYDNPVLTETFPVIGIFCFKLYTSKN